jgi:hypothetical protein
VLGDARPSTTMIRVMGDRLGRLAQRFQTSSRSWLRPSNQWTLIRRVLCPPLSGESFCTQDAVSGIWRAARASSHRVWRVCPVEVAPVGDVVRCYGPQPVRGCGWVGGWSITVRLNAPTPLLESVAGVGRVVGAVRDPSICMYQRSVLETGLSAGRSLRLSPCTLPARRCLPYQTPRRRCRRRQ